MPPRPTAAAGAPRGGARGARGRTVRAHGRVLEHGFLGRALSAHDDASLGRALGAHDDASRSSVSGTSGRCRGRVCGFATLRRRGLAARARSRGSAHDRRRLSHRACAALSPAAHAHASAPRPVCRWVPSAALAPRAVDEHFGLRARRRRLEQRWDAALSIQCARSRRLHHWRGGRARGGKRRAAARWTPSTPRRIRSVARVHAPSTLARVHAGGARRGRRGRRRRRRLGEQQQQQPGCMRLTRRSFGGGGGRGHWRG